MGTKWKPTRILITGSNGQDGILLSEYIVQNKLDVEVILVDHKSMTDYISPLPENFTFDRINLSDYDQVGKLIMDRQPNVIFHFASAVGTSQDYNNTQDAGKTLISNITMTYNLLEWCKKVSPDSKFLYACSSEVFGDPLESPQTMDTPHNPRSLYGISKSTGYHLVKYYHNVHNYNCHSVTLYNHVSEYTPTSLLFGKLLNHACMLELGKTSKKCKVGNLECIRNIAYARTVVKNMYYILMSGNVNKIWIKHGYTLSVKELARHIYSSLGYNWKDHIEIDFNLYKEKEELDLIPIELQTNTESFKSGFLTWLNVVIKRKLEMLVIVNPELAYTHKSTLTKE